MITTKHGNQYTEKEWQEMMAEWANEVSQAQDYLDGCEIIKEIAARELEKIGVSQEKSYGIAHKIFEEGLDGIQFSSPEKQKSVEDIEGWMSIEERKIR